MKVIILGSGTSMGVPMAGCSCRVCSSDDQRDKRLRTSALLEMDNKLILIDTSVDYRQQIIGAGINRLDAVLYTHHHVDHILGMDDLRSFMLLNGHDIPLYALEETAANLRRVFQYAFDGHQPGSLPLLKLNIIDNQPFEVGGIRIVPIPLFHGSLPILGFRVGDFAYCTDVSRIPETSFELLQGLDVLILGALRYKRHPTHFSVEEAVRAAQHINAKRTFFTHISHDILHAEANEALPVGIELAYDGLTLEISGIDSPKIAKP